MNKKSIKPLFMVTIGAIMTILFLGSSCNDKLIISSNKCTNLDRDASMCIVRDDTGTPTSIDWFSAVGCPLSQAQESMLLYATADHRAMAFP